MPERNAHPGPQMDQIPIGYRGLIAIPSNYGRGKIPWVSQTSPSAKNRALGKANLPRVLHSGKNSTRGREALPSAAECLALGKERHSAKALFPECNTRGRAALGKEKCYLTAHPVHAVKTKKNCFAECRTLALGKEAGFPECPVMALGEVIFFCFFLLIFLWGLLTLFKTLCSNLGQFWLFFGIFH